MRRQITLSHLARQLGVHHTTVSMALRDSDEISESMRKRVKDLARRMHYTPNHIARSLRRRSTRTLGLLFPYATLPYYAALLDALDTEADARGLHLEVHFHQWSCEQEREALQTMLERRVDGVVLMAAMGASMDTLEDLVPATGMPIVMVGLGLKNPLPRCVRGCVATDMEEGSKKLGEHLLDMGHRRIALLLP